MSGPVVPSAAPLLLHAAIDALRAHLSDAGAPGPFGAPAVARPAVRLVSSAELAAGAALDGALSLYLYHVAHAAAARTALPALPRPGTSSGTAFDLHVLLTAWASDARGEHELLAWGAREIERRPVLEAHTPSGSARVQVLAADIAANDVFAVWAALGASYRLSLAYLLRAGPLEDPDTGAIRLHGRARDTPR